MTGDEDAGAGGTRTGETGTEGTDPGDTGTSGAETGNSETAGVGVERSADALLLDVMLGKLATYLRMCGYDAAYAVERGIEADDALVERADEEDRLLVSRDEGLVRRAGDAVLVRGRAVADQLSELRDAGFVLELAPEPAYCSACNGDLERVDRTEPTPDYAPAADERDVWRCVDCGQHFWKGSHWDDVAATLDGL